MLLKVQKLDLRWQKGLSVSTAAGVYDFRQLQLRSAAGSSPDGLSLSTGCCWTCGDIRFSCSDMGLSMRVVELKWLILSDMCGLGCAKWRPEVCNVLILKAFPPRRCVSVNLRRIVLSAYYVIASPETNMSLRGAKHYTSFWAALAAWESPRNNVMFSHTKFRRPIRVQKKRKRIN